MGRIKQLSSHEAQKIAAGEVVERPANIVKELVENALDAGATTITIHVHDGGKSAIRVIDNGCGMDSEDAQSCFLHHATSKLTRVEDLSTLQTFGFRGEALSSISAVSKVTLATKEAETLLATKVVVEQGKIISHETASGNTGTDIYITDLFFNVPVRKKFLKTTETELRHIILLFQAFCLQHRSIHFKLYSQDALLFNCPPATTLNVRVSQLWDHTVAAQLIPITTTHDHAQLEGVSTNHTYTRYDRSALFFFVNNRWIKNHILAKALLKGYLNVLPADKFPLAALSITIDPMHIDVNVHPRKEEIQFLHPRIIESVIQSTIKEALEKNLSKQLNKEISFNLPPKTLSWASPSSFRAPVNNMPPFVASNATPLSPLSETFSTIPDTITNGTIEPLLKQSSVYQETDSYTIIGQLHKTYILIEKEEGLFLVDQHAAHERILYEAFANRFARTDSIQLLFAQILSLTKDEYRLLESAAHFFAENNIIIEPMDNYQIAIQAVPVHLKEIDIRDIIRHALGWLIDYQKLDTEELSKKMHERLHAQMACKAAVKAGDTLSLVQMQKLLHDLERTPHRFSCPHGRPTGWLLSVSDIEKKFKRIL